MARCLRSEKGRLRRLRNPSRRVTVVQQSMITLSVMPLAHFRKDLRIVREVHRQVQRSPGPRNLPAEPPPEHASADPPLLCPLLRDDVAGPLKLI